MSKTPLLSDAEARAEAAYERFGTRKPHCTAPGCTEADWRSLTGSYPDIKCYEHRAAEQGRSPTERQHPAGRANDPQLEVPMPGNHHRPMDDYKADWPEKTRLNPEGSPALRAAAYVHAAWDWLRVIGERLLAPVAAWLEALEERMCELHGPRWWEAIGLPDLLGRRGCEP